MKFIDVHCHLDGGHYGDLTALFAVLAQAQIKKLIVVGVDVETSEFCRSLAKANDMCRFAAGVHPTELKNYSEGDLEKIAEIASDKNCVAIGEIGLDYHYPDTDKPLQRRIFTEQLQLAHRLGLPVQIHSRDCAEDMLAILKEHSALLSNGALMHCYSHSAEIAIQLLKLGVYFSFGGTSTYSGSKRVKRVIASLPPDRILTETDSPYLPPKSLAGHFPNTPASIHEILAEIAHIRGATVEEAAQTVWANAHRLFKKL